MYTLVVVDMQPDFNAANGARVTKNCLREINQAMKDKAFVIFLEYYGSGPTIKTLSDAVKTYSKAHFSTKHDDDGSDNVDVFIRKYKMKHNLIKVCGVNTDCCVRSTVEGLSCLYKRATIDVIADACDSDWNHSNGITMLKKIPNCNVVRSGKVK